MRRYTWSFVAFASALATSIALAAPPRSIEVSGEMNGWCVEHGPALMEVCGEMEGGAAGIMWTLLDCYGPFGRTDVWMGEGCMMTWFGTFDTIDYITLYPTYSRTEKRWEGVHLVFGPEGYLGYLTSEGTADAVLLDVHYTYQGILTPKQLPGPVEGPRPGE